MKKLFKNKITEAKFGAANYTFAQVATICVVGFFMVFASASAVFGLNTNQELLANKQESLVEAQDEAKLNKAIKESDENLDAVSETPPKTQHANADKVSDPNAAAFNISFYPTYDYVPPDPEEEPEEKSQVINVPVFYENESGTADIEPFAKTNIRRDSIQSTNSLGGDEGFKQSQFDVRYYEDCYETADGQHL